MSNSWVLFANQWAATLMPAFFRATWQGGLFIAIVWVTCRIFRTLPTASRNWLWWIVSVQMLIRLVAVATIPLPVLPAVHEASPFAYAAPTNPFESRASSGALIASPAVQSTAVSNLPLPDPIRPRTSLSANAIALIVWMIGVGLCVIANLRRIGATRRMLISARPVIQGPILDIVQEFCVDTGQKQPRVLESSQALCPLLAGWLRPAIVVPIELTRTLDTPQLRMALAHEFAHLRRKDLWLGIFPALTQILFFFHPLAWLASHEFAATREAACDSEALRFSGASPAAFARLLLNTAQARSSMAVLGTAFGYRLIQRRISMLKTLTVSNARRYRGTSTIVLALAALCALPWSVTAQSTTHSTPQANAKTVAKSHKAGRKKHSISKAAAKSHSKLVAAMTVSKTVPAFPTGAVHPTRLTGGMVFGHTTPATGVSRAIPVVGLRREFGAVSSSAAPEGFGGGGRNATAARGESISTPAISATSSAGGGYGGGTVAAPARAIGGGGFSRGGNTATSAAPGVNIGAFGGSASAAAPADGGSGFGGISGSTTLSAQNAEPATLGGLMLRRELSHPSKCEISHDGANVELDRAELHTALVEIFKANHCNFVIKSDVQPDVVTASLKGLSIEGILRTVLASVHQHLSFRRNEEGIFIVEPSDK